MYYYESGRRKGIILWIIILFVIIGLLNTPFVRRIKPLRAVKTLASNVIFPFKYLGSALYNGSTRGLTSFIRIKGVQKENEALKMELAEEKAKIRLLEDLSRENERLRKALYFRSVTALPRLLPAEIIGRSGSNWFEIVEINRGLEDKVSPDSAVVNEEGLVGRVFEVSRFSSKVLLITDPSSAVSIIDAETGDMGIASGNSIGPIKIKYMSATAVINIGDKIITSGMSDIFPKGIKVGTVKYIDRKDYDIFQRVEIRPAVNFSKLEKVFVLAKYK